MTDPIYYNCYNLLPDHTFLDLFLLKAFADDKFNTTQNKCRMFRQQTFWPGRFGHGRFGLLKVRSRIFWPNSISDIFGPINPDRSIVGKKEVVNHDTLRVNA